MVFKRETRTWSLEKEPNRLWHRVLRKHEEDCCLDDDNDDWICEELKTVLNGQRGDLTKKDKFA